MATAMHMAGAVAVSLPPADPVIDLQHLSRMTLGERSLEREVLALFERQAGMLLRRIVDGDRGVVATSAHTLKGSARGIGAWRVAEAAEAVEFADASAQSGAVVTLAGAIGEACAAIERLLLQAD